MNDEVLKNIFKIDLSFNDLIDAFVGSVNLTKNLYKQPDNYQVDNDKYILTYVDSASNRTTIYKVDIRELGITNYYLKTNEDSLLIEGKYSGFEQLDNVSVPFTIEIINHAADQRLSIDYKNIVTNKRNVSIDFSIPDDATIVSW